MSWRSSLLTALFLAFISPALAADLPEYRVIDKFKVPGGDLWGDVLIPALEPGMPIEVLAEAMVEIAKKEEFDRVDFYRTEEARRANLSSSYNENHPGVLEAGFLGTVEAEQFRPSITAHPEFYAPTATTKQARDPSVPDFEVVERKKLNDALVISVRTNDMENIFEIAKHVVENNRGEHFMVRVFFYEPEQSIALHRIEWTEKDGYFQSY